MPKPQYGNAHARRRAQLLATSYYTACPLCLRVMLPGQPLDLDHVVPGDWDGEVRITHSHCNRRAGQALGKARQRARERWSKRRIIPPSSQVW